MSLASTLTTGRKFPDGSDCPDAGDVVFLTGEDGLADTVVPRLIAHGADRERVHCVRCYTRHDKDGSHETAVRLDVNVPDVEQLFENLDNPIAMIIDPVSQYLGRADSHKDADVRSTLGPLIANANNTASFNLKSKVWH